MSGESVFTVNGSTAAAAQPITLAEAGLRERAHLQEWVLAHPQVLGADMKIIADEFGRWTDHSGAIERDRLDVLGYDKDGRLVVVELKRDHAPDTVEMQALKYAALVSRFTEDDLVKAHAQHLSRRRRQPVSTDEARAEIEEWAPLDEANLRLPRIVLMASGFPATVTATVVFLHQQLDLDVRLLAFQAYRTTNDIVVTVSQHYPPPDVEEFVLSPEVKEQRQARQDRQIRRRDAVPRLVEAGAIEPGTRLTFVAQTRSLREQIEPYFAELPARRFATWLDDTREPLQWEADGQTYSPTGLTQKIIEEVTGRSGPTQGTMYWFTPEDVSLVDLALALPAADSVTAEDHLAALPPDLADAYSALDEALRGLGPDVTVRSRIKGLAYFASRKLTDVRIRSEHLSLYVRNVPPHSRLVQALPATVAKRYVHVQVRTPSDVANLLPLLEEAYRRQAQA